MSTAFHLHQLFRDFPKSRATIGSTVRIIVEMKTDGENKTLRGCSRRLPPSPPPLLKEGEDSVDSPDLMDLQSDITAVSPIGL